MYTIYFKNGITVSINKNMADVLNKKIIEGCLNFQTFSDQTGKLLSIINLSEVVYVGEVK